MIMLFIFGGLFLSSLVAAGHSPPETGEELPQDHDDPDNEEGSAGNLIDWGDDEGEEHAEDGADDEASSHEETGTSQGDALSAVGDGAYGDVVLDRGLFETSESWDDVIKGLEGEDTIYAQGGHFLLYGGEDDDLLVGEDASGLAFGGHGDDSISVSGSRWIAAGEDGNDTLSGGAASDTLIGGDGSDSILGGEGDDLLIGHGLWYTHPATGSIEISALLSDASDTLIGGDGNDTMIATAGDTIVIGEGDDVMLGYISLGQASIHIAGADAEDYFVLEIVVPEDFDLSLLDDRAEIEAEDGGRTVYVAGYPVIHFSGGADIATSVLEIRVSVHDADGKYLGYA